MKNIIFLLIVYLAIFPSQTAFAAGCTAPQCTKVINNGSTSAKKNLVIIGDGFAAGNQDEWRQVVNTMVLDGVFEKDLFLEDQNAFNVYRLNLVSVESGVSQRVYD